MGETSTTLADAAVVERDGEGDAARLLERLADEQAARVAWVHEKIAHHAFVPRQPPRPWAGRGDIIELARQQFAGLDVAGAGALVDLAVTELWAIESGGDSGPVKLDLMLLRFKDIRKLVRKAIADGRTETVYVYEKHPTEANKLIERKAKEKRFTGVDMAGVAKLMEVELAIAQLEGLAMKHKGGGMDAIAKIFEQMDERRKAGGLGAENDDRVKGSKAQQLLAAPIDGSSAAGMNVLRLAYAEVQQVEVTGSTPVAGGGGKQRRKRVASRPSEGGGG